MIFIPPIKTINELAKATAARNIMKDFCDINTGNAKNATVPNVEIIRSCNCARTAESLNCISPASAKVTTLLNKIIGIRSNNDRACDFVTDWFIKKERLWGKMIIISAKQKILNIDIEAYERRKDAFLESSCIFGRKFVTEVTPPNITNVTIMFVRSIINA